MAHGGKRVEDSQKQQQRETLAAAAQQRATGSKRSREEEQQQQRDAKRKKADVNKRQELTGQPQPVSHMPYPVSVSLTVTLQAHNRLRKQRGCDYTPGTYEPARRGK